MKESITGSPACEIRPGTVCAVVVTFKRKALLRELLTALPRQSRPPDCILVVDNRSSDGTVDMVRQEFPGVTLLALDINSGGAGGFRSGMEWAWRSGYEWLWIMDDDVEPYEEALDTLLSYGPVSDFIHLRRDDVNAWEGIWDPHTFTIQLYPREYSFENGKPYMVLNYACFEGPLIHRRIIDSIGLPDARFFVSGDDALYGFQASFHTNILYVNRRGFKRKLPHPIVARMSAYLLIRNKFLIYEELHDRGLTLPRYLFWIYQFNLAFYLLRQLRNRKESRNMTAYRAVFQGLRDGSRGIFGAPPWLR